MIDKTEAQALLNVLYNAYDFLWDESRDSDRKTWDEGGKGHTLFKQVDHWIDKLEARMPDEEE